MNPDHCSSVMRIEKLPTAVLAHILSFLPDKEAVRTCLLSRRWKEVWKFNDKISRLPTDVLVRILSYLPAIEAVRTCVLSKHWKQAQAWKLIKNFFFDDSGVGFRLHVFEKALAGVLTQMEEARGIQKISICCSEMPDGDVLKWLLDFAFEHHIRELELRIGGGGQFELPYEIISSTHLEVLTLHLNLRNPSLNGIYFTALKKLDVGLYRPESSLTETFFNNLPVLEDLSIKAVVDGISVTKFYITSHILKSLTITLTREGAGKNDHTVHIRAKNLERLYVKDSTLVNYFIHEAHFLKETSLDFSYTGDQHVQKPWVLRFFLSITTVRWLNLSEDGLSVLSFVDNLLPTFSDVTHLNVSIKEAGLPMLATILHRSLRLKAMTILLKFSDRDQVLWMEPTKVPYCLKANLKKIKIQGCTGGTAEVKIIEYILKKAEVLEMMVIKFNFEGGEIPAMISEFERASHTCDIEIFEDGHQR